MSIDQYVLNPSQHFESPDALMRDKRLSKADRLRILRSWRLDVERLQESSAEGLEGNDHAALLGQIVTAIDALDERN